MECAHYVPSTMNLTPLELIVFPSMLLMFVLAVAALALWTMHSTRRTPLSPPREGLRVYRDLSPAEYALATYHDPATVLTAAVIDLLQSGKATVRGFEPFLERMYRVLIRFPTHRFMSYGSLPFGILVLLAPNPIGEEDTRKIMELRGGALQTGITTRPWVVDLSSRKVHSQLHLDGMGERTSRDLVSVLEAALSV